MSEADKPPDLSPKFNSDNIPVSDEDKGKCYSCGFLSLRTTDRHVSGPRYYEMDASARSGELHRPDTVQVDSRVVSVISACIRGVADLQEEIVRERKGGISARDAVRKVFRKDRKCTCWYQYIDGFSPKEHLAMMLFESLEKQRRESDENRERERRAFEERMEKERREFDERLEENRRKSEAGLALQLENDRRKWIEKRDENRGIAEQRNSKLIRRLTITGLILATLQVLGMTKDSLLAKSVSAN